MQACASFRILLGLLVAAASSLSAASSAAAGGVLAHTQETPSSIVIGFVGGFVRHDNAHHGPVLFAKRLRQTTAPDAYVQVFENRRRKAAFQTILRLLDRDHDGALSDDEKAQAHIILFGQSWGAAAVVMLARELDRIGIPVLLTVQVDSVAKFWQSDSIIPDNVAAAANFYQPHGLLHGRRQITAADPAHTQILGNFRFDYRETPVHCEGYSWLDRNLVPSHMQSECDPHLWAQVENLVRQRLDVQPNAVAALPQQ